MDKRRLAWRLVVVLIAPLIIVVMVPLAIIAAVCFYLLAMIHGFWLLCRALPGWIWHLKDRRVPRKPHFLDRSEPPVSKTEPPSHSSEG